MSSDKNVEVIFLTNRQMHALISIKYVSAWVCNRVDRSGCKTKKSLNSQLEP